MIKVLLASWSDSSKKRYQGPWKVWSSWCTARGLCPLSALVAEVLNFLTELAVQHNCKHRTVAVYKLVISQARSHGVEPLIGQLPVGSVL